MSKAGLRDFDYMKDVTSITELRKQMRLTGAEVLPKKIHKCEDLLLISDRQHQGCQHILSGKFPLEKDLRYIPVDAAAAPQRTLECLRRV